MRGERPEATGLGFAGDALVYDLADGRFLGGVVLDIPDDPDPAPLGSEVHRRLELAVMGRVRAPSGLTR